VEVRTGGVHTHALHDGMVPGHEREQHGGAHPRDFTTVRGGAQAPAASRKQGGGACGVVCV
jgi:hypothetical protein